MSAMDCPELKPMTRRRFLSLAGLTAAGLGALPRWVARAAAEAAGTSKVLLVLFQRGAADALNIVLPFDDPLYRKARPSIAVAAPKGGGATIDLDGRFGLHPALKDLLPMWKGRRLAFVHAAGSPDPTRSHFEAQDLMESAAFTAGAAEDGWLNRAAAAGGLKGPLSAVGIAPHVPRSLKGAYPAIVANSLEDLRAVDPLFTSYEKVYRESADAALSGLAGAVGDAHRRLAALAPFGEDDMVKAGYPRSRHNYHRINRDLYEMGRLIRADVGLRIGFVEMDGWDHHYDEGSDRGLLAERLEELGESLAAFYRHLGDREGDVLTVTMTEFGRTLFENPNGGTDHGHAGFMMLLAGAVKGGKVHGRWPGLEKEALFQGRDLAVTTDYRQVLGEALTGHLGVGGLDRVFPGGPFRPIGVL